MLFKQYGARVISCPFSSAARRSGGVLRGRRGSVSRWDLLLHKWRHERRRARRQPIKWIQEKANRGWGKRKEVKIGDIITTEKCTDREEERRRGRGKEQVQNSRREGSDGSDRFSNGIDPIQGHGGDEGLPAQTPCCHLDLGPIPDLRSFDPSSRAPSWPPHPLPCWSPQPPRPLSKWELTFLLRAGWKCGLKCVNSVLEEQFLAAGSGHGVTFWHSLGCVDTVARPARQQKWAARSLTAFGYWSVC